MSFRQGFFSLIVLALIQPLIACASPFGPVITKYPWTPANLSGLTAWWDASDKSTMFTDSAGTIPVTTDGDRVCKWNDKSGAGQHVTQVTTASCPFWRTNGTNSWLEFDGVDDKLTRANALTVGASFAGVWVDSTGPAISGVLTNTTDQGTNDDYVWNIAFITTVTGWDNAVTAGNGMADASHFWNNGTQSKDFAFNNPTSATATSEGVAKTHTLPIGILIGQDRGIAARFFKGRIYQIGTWSGAYDEPIRRLAAQWVGKKLGINF